VRANKYFGSRKRNLLAVFLLIGRDLGNGLGALQIMILKGNLKAHTISRFKNTFPYFKMFENLTKTCFEPFDSLLICKLMRQNTPLAIYF